MTLTSSAKFYSGGSLYTLCISCTLQKALSSLLYYLLSGFSQSLWTWFRRTFIHLYPLTPSFVAFYEVRLASIYEGAEKDNKILFWRPLRISDVATMLHFVFSREVASPLADKLLRIKCLGTSPLTSFPRASCCRASWWISWTALSHQLSPNLIRAFESNLNIIVGEEIVVAYYYW